MLHSWGGSVLGFLADCFRHKPSANPVIPNPTPQEVREYLDSCPQWKDPHYQNWEVGQLFGLTLGEAIDLANQPNAVVPPPVSLPVMPTNTTVDILDWQEVLDAGVGFIIAGNSGSGKTSAAVWLAAQICNQLPQKVFALDPHYNDAWGEFGIRSVGGIREIEACLTALIAELDARCDRKGKRQPLGEPMLIFCDEINACLERFNEPKTVSKALKRLGSEGRKFGLTLVAINQSSNVDALGIDASYRSNYVLICLCAAARKIADRWKDSDPRKQYVQATAYPCIISGAIGDAIAIHPTHGSYRQFKIKGNRPLNLTPLNQVQGEIPFLRGETAALPPAPDEDEALWADYQQHKAQGGSDRQFCLTRLGGEGGAYFKRLERLKREFGG